MNYGCYEIIGSTSYYYQTNFNMSKILAQSSDYNDILSRQFQEKSVSGKVKKRQT